MRDAIESGFREPVPHAILRRYWAEDLVRLRRADEDRRYVASQRRGRIDPNPHQIHAVIFALRRISAGEGCILADEVGLGKTIEAGLVIAQRLAEGARRILLVLPKPLMGQWANELFDLFGVKSREGGSGEMFVGDGVFVVGREFAGSERGAALLRAADPFDLCVIDEAHEIFAGIHKRFDRHGGYDDESDHAVMAHRVRSFLRQTPVLLLTATPIQNSLTELWGLVQYVEPTGTLLGNIATFRELFCEPGSNDRVLVPAQADELRRRINLVCQRTLRRQAQEFLEKPFTKRRAQLFEYQMSAEERALYDDVTDYLLEPNLCAFRGAQRLLLIGFLKLMASSVRALATSLARVANRLRRMLAGEAVDRAAEAREFARDLEDDELPGLESAGDPSRGDRPATDDPPAPPLSRVRAELERVEGFVHRAHALTTDSKAKRLIDAVRLVIERSRQGTGSGKVVIFTESLTTQDYLRETLLASDLGLAPGDITLFRGENDTLRDREALGRWQAEVGRNMPPGSRPSRQVAVRLALVHEFRTRSRIFISTEAGAKGLNLQFCESLINYDLPWNPQRIEQRIGRCHRYGQTQPVTVINFLASDNEAQRLTFQILSEKLELFGQVLDASDAVLHDPETEASELLATALGADFEAQLQRIYQRARSRDEITAELRRLSDTMAEERRRFEEVQQRTASLIESRLDESVRQVFRRIADELPGSLKRLDEDIRRVVVGFLRARDVPFDEREVDGRRLLVLPASPKLPNDLAGGATLTAGHSKDLTDADPLHLGHPLVLAAVAESRAAAADSFCVSVRAGDSTAARCLEPYHGRRGRLVVTKACYTGFEPVERLLVTAVLEGDSDPLPHEIGETLLRHVAEDRAPLDPPLRIEPDTLSDAIDEALFADHAAVARDEQARFHRMLEQIERCVDDQALVLRRRRGVLERQFQTAQAERDAAVGADARTRAETQLRELQERIDELDGRIQKLLARDDPDFQKWRDFAHRRRFAAPRTERVIDFEFVIE